MLADLGGTPPFDPAEVERFRRRAEPGLLKGHYLVHEAIVAAWGR